MGLADPSGQEVLKDPVVVNCDECKWCPWRASGVTPTPGRAALQGRTGHLASDIQAAGSQVDEAHRILGRANARRGVTTARQRHMCRWRPS